MANNKIEIIRGDTEIITFTFTDENAAAIDLTGSTVFFTVKDKIDNDATDAAAIISKAQTSHSDPTNGETQITLTSSDTDQTPSDYLWDVQIKDSGDAISSSMYGQLKLLADITRRTT